MPQNRGTETVKPIYRSESQLVIDFCNALESVACPWGKVCHVREFSYLRGRTDVIAVDPDGRILAFEAKLTDWPRALEQAYRNTCFAHDSYVVLPKSIAQRAQRFHHDFGRRKVGMCYIENGEIVIALPSKKQNPVQSWLSELAVTEARKGDRACR